MNEISSRSLSEMTRVFLAKGGEIRKLPRGATQQRPSSLPKDLRDRAVVAKRRNSPAGSQWILSLKVIHAVEALIERRASLTVICAKIGIPVAPVWRVVERMEASGIAFPDYLRGPIEDAAPLLIASHVEPAPVEVVPPVRRLEHNEMQAFEMVRAGYACDQAAAAYGVEKDLLRRLLVERFDSARDLRAVRSFAGLQRALELRLAEGKRPQPADATCMNCHGPMPDGVGGGRCPVCAGRAPLRRVGP